MNDEVSIPLWAALTALGVLLGLLVVLVVVLRSDRRDRAVVTARLDALAAAGAVPSPVPTPTEPVARPPAPASDFVITHLGELESEPETAPQPGPVDARLFTDTLLRESVVRSAALVHGVRRALAPEVRHRIRFEVRQGTKQARRRRRSEMKTAHREWQTRRRTGLDP